MIKKCIFDKNKNCNDCGECYKCELDSKKICNNCGKCMQKEGFDLKEIKIDEVLDIPEDVDTDEEDLFVNDTYIDSSQLRELAKQQGLEEGEEDTEKIEYEYIEDYEDIKAILENEDEFNKNANEVFPGLIKIARKN